MKLDKRKVINKTYIMGATAIATVAILGGTAFCADDPLAVITNLSDFVFSLIKAVGMIILGMGIVQLGMSLKSHDPSQRANRLYDSCWWSSNYIC